MYDEMEGSLSAEEEEEEQDRSLATAKYTAIPPFFSPVQGYLNFEVAIEKSDSGELLRLYLSSPQHTQLNLPDRNRLRCLFTSSHFASTFNIDR
jgi:hypothetical protein